MRWPKWFARMRYGVWARRVEEYRWQWNKATIAGKSAGELNGVTAESFYENLTTRAMLKQVKWRKRAGIRKATGGRISKGRPYLIGGEPEWDLPRRVREQAERKLSEPPDRPAS